MAKRRARSGSPKSLGEQIAFAIESKPADGRDGGVVIQFSALTVGTARTLKIKMALEKLQIERVIQFDEIFRAESDLSIRMHLEEMEDLIDQEWWKSHPELHLND